MWKPSSSFSLCRNLHNFAMNSNLSETNFSEVHEQSAKLPPVTEPKVQTLITSTLDSNMTNIPSEENPNISINAINCFIGLHELPAIQEVIQHREENRIKHTTSCIL